MSSAPVLGEHGGEGTPCRKSSPAYAQSVVDVLPRFARDASDGSVVLRGPMTGQRAVSICPVENAGDGQVPSPADLEEDYYASLYAGIIHDRVAIANSQGMNVAVADFTEVYKSVASGTVIGGIPLHIGTLELLVDMATWSFTDFSSALHAYVVIDAINEHYGVSLPLPDLASY